MCGIFAYIGGRPVLITIIQGLHRLEYRGYDGAGVAMIKKDEEKIILAKTAGTVAALEKLLKEQYSDSILAHPESFCLGIGHTRWPTMGLPTTENTHPFISNDGNWAVVLNGIIENSTELTSFMKKEGYKFESQNDVEVIAILLEHLHKTYHLDTLSTFVLMLSKIVGAYAVCVLHSTEKKVYAARLSSPMSIGIGENELFIASDPIAFREHTEKVIHLDDHEVCVASETEHHVYKLAQNFEMSTPLTSEESAARIVRIPFEPAEYEIGDFPHYMLKEIYQQPTAVQQTFAGKIDNITSIHVSVPESLRKIVFLACGTSYYASLVGRHLIEQFAGIPVDCEYASEFIYRRCLCNKNDLVIAVSQSGETADTREALLLAKKQGAQLAGIVNVVGSQIARIAGQGMYLHAGAEIGVASTKAFSCQVCAMVLLSAFLAQNEEYSLRIQQELRRVPDGIQRILSSTSTMTAIDAIVEAVKNKKSALFLGRGVDYPLALEGALKMKEISYIHAEGYPAGEMKHGPIALVEKGMPVFFILGASKETQFTKVLNNMEEIKTRQGTIITITDAPEMKSAVNVKQNMSPSLSSDFLASPSSSPFFGSLSTPPANAVSSQLPRSSPSPTPSPSPSPSLSKIAAPTPSAPIFHSSSSHLANVDVTLDIRTPAASASMTSILSTSPSSTTLDASSSSSSIPSASTTPTSISNPPTPSLAYAALSNDPDDVDRVLHLSDYVVRVPHISEAMSPMLMVVPLQLIAYKVAVAKGLNPDRPRNLAKSVTVE
ncbi:Glutamine-fructose-6-phosphate transaminase [Monocercomonoides exilis]|uniref:Glutamine-fructose-6-phosphate transaminase n=1 Tax=Monocercomonoides exilis TaxID=2049356 RepID=UPI003559EC8C|nr:Glutamine-fructose-6-phosphate transaminase [Monocercomonoides exilis]|eukprot:MONOS_4525.1-p1 / transcript=MONOS_4525.1 / gene=MONOS_4525 / organism=Monocercomonoides_exilis_PA203 / gene_product=Glutamine-fructose-6-phosphate transaminase / transcript_product=Glutamine-fructose-6-phosphate transaminase / location=Mono_scaffold00121:69995-72489(-) / protein_length=775 / sequence_SO=supercontig / SO=protein_coding / is_pseudo=false